MLLDFVIKTKDREALTLSHLKSKLCECRFTLIEYLNEEEITDALVALTVDVIPRLNASPLLYDPARDKLYLYYKKEYCPLSGAVLLANTIHCMQCHITYMVNSTHVCAI